MSQLENKRLELHKILKGVLTSNNLEANVYFQPPENLKMKYPCIVYTRRYITKNMADNTAYLLDRQYTVTYIDKEANSGVLDSLLALNYCRYMSHAVVDSLNQDTFEIYY